VQLQYRLLRLPVQHLRLRLLSLRFDLRRLQLRRGRHLLELQFHRRLLLPRFLHRLKVHHLRLNLFSERDNLQLCVSLSQSLSLPAPLLNDFFLSLSPVFSLRL